MTIKFNKKEIYKHISFLQIKSDYFNKHSSMWTAPKIKIKNPNMMWYDMFRQCHKFSLTEKCTITYIFLIAKVLEGAFALSFRKSNGHF